MSKNWNLTPIIEPECKNIGFPNLDHGTDVPQWLHIVN